MSRKEAKALRHQNDIDELISREQKWLEQAERKFSSAEGMADAAEKILALRELQNFLSNMYWHIDNNLEEIADRHIRDDRKFRKSRYIYSNITAEKVRQLREKNPGIADIQQAINKQNARAAVTLTETVKSCHGHLDEVSNSPFYPKAWKEHEPLRDLFAAAKAAREALGDNVPASQRLKLSPKPAA